MLGCVKTYSEQDLRELIPVLYVSVRDMSKFSSFLGLLGRVTTSQHVVFRKTNHLLNADTALMTSAPALDMNNLYNIHYGRLKTDAWITLKRSRASQLGMPFVSSDVITDSQMRNTEFYNDFLRGSGWFHNLNMTFLLKKPYYSCSSMKELGSL